MKRFLVLLTALTLLTGFVFAEDIGLTAGLEFGVVNIGEGDGFEKQPYLMPNLVYENAFLDEALDVYAELDYSFGFNKNGGDSFPMLLEFDLALGYNLKLGSASTLSFLLEDYWAFCLSPEVIEPDLPYFMELYPGVKFNQGFDFGDIYAKLEFPLYFFGYKDADLACDIWFTAGFKSNVGFGIYITEKFGIKPEAEHHAIRVVPSFEYGPIYAELKTDLIGSDDFFLNLTPKVNYNFNAFNFYVKCEFDFIGTDGDIWITPALGATFSF